MRQDAAVMLLDLTLSVLDRVARLLIRAGLL
jgi:hypothetical protein